MTEPRPDRGYAWVVVACCAFFNFALFGIFRSAGLLYVAILQSFRVSREEASWPFSMCAAMFDLSGPLASLLTRRTSIRKASLLGSAVATVGLALCYCAHNMLWINIWFGFVYGTGVGVVTALPPIIINKYFSRHKTTALGLAFAGVSVSSFIFPPAMEYLLDVYDLRGLFLLLAGVVMNTLVAGSLLREPAWLSCKTSLPKTADHLDWSPHSNGLTNEESESVDSKDRSLAEQNRVSKLTKQEIQAVYVNQDAMDPFIPNSTKSSAKGNHGLGRDDCQFALPTSGIPSLKFPKDSPPFSAKNGSRLGRFKAGEDEKVLEPLRDHEVFIVPTGKKSKTVVEYKDSSLLKDIKDLLRHSTFYALAVSSAVFYLVFISFLVVIVDYATDEGVPETESIYILSAFSLVDMFGRCGLGWLTDRQFIEAKNLYIINSVAIGVLLQFYPSANSLLYFSVTAAFHGLFTGSTITLLYLLQAEYAGDEKMALIVGLVHFTNGLASFLRPPMIGLFRDVIGSYDWMFRGLGALSLLTAVLWTLESRLQSHQRKAAYEDQVSKADMS